MPRDVEEIDLAWLRVVVGRKAEARVRRAQNTADQRRLPFDDDQRDITGLRLPIAVEDALVADVQPAQSAALDLDDHRVGLKGLGDVAHRKSVHFGARHAFAA